MCGIYGYIGRGDVFNELINGLTALEYRGYDSAGVAMARGEEIVVCKTNGKVKTLSEKYRSSNNREEYWGGIGHTRWATHGCPREINAHPHWDCNERFYVVHNGIIENYEVVKKYLLRKGHRFISETDTEVFAHLLEEYAEREPLERIRLSLAHINGSFSFLIMDRENPGVLIGLKKGSPLMIGAGSDEFYLSSDLSGFPKVVKECVYLEEEEIAVISINGYEVFDFNSSRVNKDVEIIKNRIEMMDKNGYEHFMKKEIFEQSETIKSAFRGRVVKETGNVKLNGIESNDEVLAKAKRIIISACGTSWHAGLIGEYYFEKFAGIPTEVEYASEFRYRDPIVSPSDICFFISQSGETADTLAAMDEALGKSGVCLGICNTVNSSLARKSHGGVYLHAGREIGVASTKAFTSQVTVLFLCALYMGRLKKMSRYESLQLMKELEKIPEKIEVILKNEKKIMEMAKLIKDHRNALFLGRGVNYPVALEGALKLKEISYIHAEGYPAAEMKHGPIALIDEDMPVFVIATKDPWYHKTVSNVKEIKAREGKVFSIISPDDREIKELSDGYMEVPLTHPFLCPLLNVVPLQLLAYYAALFRNCDVDQPRNLAKSVTVE